MVKETPRVIADPENYGAGLAVIMPAWMEFVYKHDVDRFVQMATRVFGCEPDEANPENTALAGIKAFRQFLHDIGMPINFAELGAKEEDITEIYKIAVRATL